MKYLLDVSALLALGFDRHEFHAASMDWVSAMPRDQSTELATCALTELGFIRILAQASQYGLTISEARNLLFRLKHSSRVKFTFIADNHDISRLPRWVATPKQITDGHLLELAKANGAVLATFDRKIPGAFLIFKHK
jgi:predicted nucleic acid-binding protein